MSEARAFLSDTGLDLALEEERNSYSDEIPTDAVVWQSVEQGTRVKRGSRVSVARSLGPLVTRIPDLAGESTRSALIELTDRGLVIRELSNINIEEVAGIVASSPSAETDVGRNTPVSILIAGNSTHLRYVMPDLIDGTIDVARQRLERMGFRIAPLRYEMYPGIGDGVIIRQSPLPGNPVTKASLITLTVSRGGSSEFSDPQASTLNPWEESQ